MALNWTPVSVLSIILSIIIIIIVIIISLIPKIRKIKSVILLQVTFLSMGIMFLLDAISFLYLNLYTYIVSSTLIFISLIFLMMTVNYVTKESYLSIGTIFIIPIGILFLYFIFQIDMYEIRMEGGYLSIYWTGLGQYLGYLIQIFMFLYIFSWGLKTYLNAPILIKRDATLFFLGTNIISLGSSVLYVLTIIEPMLIIASNLALIIGSIFFISAFINEPKILYILPYKIHRIIVKDKDGDPLFEQQWTDTEFETNIFAGYLNAVKIMSEKVLDIGEPIEISLEKGILIIQDSQLVTIGLIASKSSKLLRNSLILFTSAFEERFNDFLKSGVKNPLIYESAHELIELYFSNFPHSLITGKKNTLLLTANIPKKLEYKFEEAFEGEIELKKIKEELAQAPLCVIPEFLSLYKDLNQELLEDSRKEVKKLE